MHCASKSIEQIMLGRQVTLPQVTRNWNEELRAEIRKARFSYSDSSASEPSLSGDEASETGNESSIPNLSQPSSHHVSHSARCSKHGLASECSSTPSAISINNSSQDLDDVSRAELAREIEALDNMLRLQAEAHEAEINHLMKESAALQERLAIPGRH